MRIHGNLGVIWGYSPAVQPHGVRNPGVIWGYYPNDGQSNKWFAKLALNRD